MQLEERVHVDRNPAPLTSVLTARNITVSFEQGARRVLAIQDVTLQAGEGEFVAIIGPSGCGKSTLFRVIAGLQKPQTGTVLMGDREITGALGQVAYMPQKDLLMPWKNVLDNVCLGLELQGMPRREARRRAISFLPGFGLEGFADRYPSALSGGMLKRAALLRTFLTGRDTLLLDEPFGSLDALTRTEMQEWLLDIWGSLRKTILLVTHDVDEAIYLSDRVYVMTSRPGRIKSLVDIPLPRPRRYDEIVHSADFSDLRVELLGLLRRRRGPNAPPALRDGEQRRRS